MTEPVDELQLIARKTGDVEKWVLAERNRLISRARPLSSAEKGAMSGHFTKKTLDTARLAFEPKVADPPFMTMDLVDVLESRGLYLDVGSLSGITFNPNLA